MKMKNTIYENFGDCGKSQTIYPPPKKTLLELMRVYIDSKGTEYKVNTQTLIPFLYVSSKN